jgi:hypothetical protein
MFLPPQFASLGFPAPAVAACSAASDSAQGTSRAHERQKRREGMSVLIELKPVRGPWSLLVTLKSQEQP